MLKQLSLARQYAGVFNLGGTIKTLILKAIWLTMFAIPLVMAVLAITILMSPALLLERMGR